MKKISFTVVVVSLTFVPIVAFADWHWKWDMSLQAVAKARLS